MRWPWLLKLFPSSDRLTLFWFSLAYAEMRLILARLVFNFDINLAPESRSWTTGQKVFFFWDKPPLWTYYKPMQKGLYA